MLGAYYSITTWLPTFLANERHLSVGASTGYLLMLITGSLAGYLVSAWLTDIIGRRRGFILFAACAMVLILLYTRLPVAGGMFLIGFPLGFFILGIFSGMGACLAELYPSAVRGSGQGFTYSVGRGIGGLVSFVDRRAEHALSARRCHRRIHGRSVCPGDRVGAGDSGDSRTRAHDGKRRRIMSRWEFWIDRGGTFTDVIGRAPDKSLHTLKLLSENAAHYDDAAVEGMRRMLKVAPSELITPQQVACVKMGTTVATNALLERKGERTLLVITRGFRDALRIATQARPRLFDRHIVLPEMLYERVIEAVERVGAHGETVQALDAAALEAQLRSAFADGFRSCAIVFLHGYRYVHHEVAAAGIARDVGFTQVSVSHRVSPLMKLVPRGDTTVVDAYLSPILRRYCDKLADLMPGVPIFFMQSSGGLTQSQRFHGKDAILSGPAGGIVGMVRTAQARGHRKLIGFDMGGTSTDVSHFAGEFERAFDTEVGGVRVRAPMMSIHSIAAGGGSIVQIRRRAIARGS